MCGRFVRRESEGIAERFGAAVPAATQAALTARYNVAPTQDVPIVVADGGGAARTLAVARWGLEPRFRGADRAVLFNARAETLEEKASFRRLLPSRRCLVPADGFYEWERLGNKKLPWLYELQGGGLFAFAGLYDRWVDAEGREMTACAIITTTPNELVLPVHGRMPVILGREAEDAWLDPALTAPEALRPLLAPYPAAEMRRVAVSPAVNSGRIDAPHLLEPIAA